MKKKKYENLICLLLGITINILGMIFFKDDKLLLFYEFFVVEFLFFLLRAVVVAIFLLVTVDDIFFVNVGIDRVVWRILTPVNGDGYLLYKSIQWLYRLMKRVFGEAVNLFKKIKPKNDKSETDEKILENYVSLACDTTFRKSLYEPEPLIIGCGRNILKNIKEYNLLKKQIKEVNKGEHDIVLAMYQSYFKTLATYLREFSEGEIKDERISKKISEINKEFIDLASKKKDEIDNKKKIENEVLLNKKIEYMNPSIDKTIEVFKEIKNDIK